jgi:serine/threonine protein phosphatase PrpC
MPDPQVLYVVTAVVVLALVAWVIAALSRSRDAGTDKSTGIPATAGPATAGGLPMTSKREASGASRPSPPSREAGAKESPPKAAGPQAAAATALAGPAPGKSAPLRSGASKSGGANGSLNLPSDMVEGASASHEVTVEVEEEEEPTGPHALILISAVGRTDPGLKRKHNEDAYVILEKHHLFCIADGMGRHAAGEVASKLCVDAVAEAYNKDAKPAAEPDPTLPKRANMLRSAILLGNERIFQQAHDVEEYAGMGTTVVACYFSPNNQRVYIAHVGDSRCYRVRGGVLQQITKDHTLGAAGIQGKSSSVLSRAVGVEERVEVDITMESPLPGDLYLLCSDGLSRMLTDPEIEQTLKSTRDLEASTSKLIEMANARGGRDNITTIVVRVEDAPRRSSIPPR